MKKVFLEEFAAMTSQKALLTSNMVKGKYIDLKGAVLFIFTKIMYISCLKIINDSLHKVLYNENSFSGGTKSPNVLVHWEN